MAAALSGEEHCGIKTAVAALAERTRRARRTNILAAIVAKSLVMCLLRF